jgi:acetoin utilization deacetylase AcuC-like enzyme
MTDEDYLKTLHQVLPDLLTHVRPDFVFYDAGVDPHQDDLLGKLALTNWGLFERDLFVLNTCLRSRYPVACVIGGGYAKDLHALTYRHSIMHRAASQVFQGCRL